MLHGQTHYSLVSSFLRELPDELLHWISPRITARSAFKPAYSSYPAQKTADYAAPVQRPAESSAKVLARAEQWLAGQRALWELRSERMAAFVEKLQQESPSHGK